MIVRLNELRKLAESFGATPSEARDPDNKVVMQMTLEELEKFANHFYHFYSAPAIVFAQGAHIAGRNYAEVPDVSQPITLGAQAPFIGMDREWTVEEKAGINDALRQYGWKDGARSHELKTDPEVFEAVLEVTKTHEIRYNDRDFKIGDTLHLRETRYTGQEMRGPEPRPLEYTGREITRVVSHVLEGYGLQPGWVVLSLEARASRPVQIPYIERFKESSGEGGGVYSDEDGDFVRFADYTGHIADIAENDALIDSLREASPAQSAEPVTISRDGILAKWLAYPVSGNDSCDDVADFVVELLAAAHSQEQKPFAWFQQVDDYVEFVSWMKTDQVDPPTFALFAKPQFWTKEQVAAVREDAKHLHAKLTPGKMVEDVADGEFYELLTAYGEACHLMTNSEGIEKAKDAVLRAFSAVSSPAQSGDPDAAPDKTFALLLMEAAAKSGDEGAIKLAAQLAGAGPCEKCGFVNYHCRCMTNDASEDREAFEAAAVKLGMHDLTRMGEEYLRDPVNICWLIWQVCAAAQPSMKFHGVIICHKHRPNATQEFIQAQFYREIDWGDDYSKVKVYAEK